jgi:perosamine synthetase
MSDPRSKDVSATLAYEPSAQLGVGDLAISELEKRYVNEVLDSNRLSYGPFMRRFEQEFAALHGCRFGVMSNSGTSSLQVALQALKERHGWADGDEVIVPAVTFVATANIVLHNRMTPVFVDVLADTYNIDPAGIEAKIGPRTRAIVPVHLFGLPADMDPILELARAHDLKVIEDSCETMFASYRGRPVGSFGDVACFSTYVAHFLVTGVGGLGTTNDGELAVAMRSLINHGRDAIYLSIDDDETDDPERLFMIADKRFSFVSLGHSFRVTELEAALGYAQLENREEIIRRRRDNARYLIERLSHLEEAIQLPVVPEDREHAFMLFPVVVRQGSRDELIAFLERNLIETRYMMPLLSQPIYRELFGDLEPEYPVAAHIDRNGFYIGCHQGFGERELDYIAGKFGEFYRAG